MRPSNSSVLSATRSAPRGGWKRRRVELVDLSWTLRCDVVCVAHEEVRAGSGRRGPEGTAPARENILASLAGWRCLGERPAVGATSGRVAGSAQGLLDRAHGGSRSTELLPETDLVSKPSAVECHRAAEALFAGPPPPG